MTAAVLEAGRLRRGPPDYVLVGVVALLLLAGLLTVYSASFAVGFFEYGNVNYFVLRQAAWAVIGLALLLAFARLDYQRLRSWSFLGMAAALLGLAAVLVPGFGVTSNGATRWLALGPLPPLQPSEFAKLAVIVYIAAWLAAKGHDIRSFRGGVLPFVMLVGMVAGLVMAQPDMGTTVLIVMTTGTLFFVAGASLRHVFALAGAGLVAGAFLVVSGGYRLDRVGAFLHAEQDPLGSGYQVLQLTIALGSGGLTGLGWGVSRQKFFYIPGAHTDGVFAVLGEELGFVGVMAVLALFAVFVWRGLRVAVRAPDPFGMLLATGITCWVAFQTLINIGGITRSIPLTGIPLPFLSYGGSALAATMAGVGVLLSISRASGGRGSAPAPPGSWEQGRPRARVRRGNGLPRAEPAAGYLPSRREG